MEFCDNCGSAMVKVNDKWACRECDPEVIDSATDSEESGTRSPRPADLSDLPTTSSGAVRKKDAMRWLDSLDTPTDRELKNAFVPKPNGFEGSTYATSVSNIRITGDPKFVETVAGLFTAIQDFEGSRTRVEINLQQTEDKETGEFTGNYALYLSVAQRA